MSGKTGTGCRPFFVFSSPACLGWAVVTAVTGSCRVLTLCLYACMAGQSKALGQHVCRHKTC